MKPKSAKIVPALITASVIALVCLFQALPTWFPHFSLFQRIEWITYDWRMRETVGQSQPAATNLAAVFIDDDSLQYVNETYGFSFPWPRQLHGRVVDELWKAGAKTIAFDILFIEKQAGKPTAEIRNPNSASSGPDDFFAIKLKQAGNVILATASDIPDEAAAGRWKALVPADLFRTNACALGHIISETDPDGVLRRAIPFFDDAEFGRIWHMGIVLAAAAMEIDLKDAVVEERRIVLRGKKLQRVIPLNADGTFHMNWSLAWNDRQLALDSFEGVLEGQSEVDWRDKLVVIGSIGTGNNITDVGSTPISEQTYLVSTHWNIANSIITGQFIRHSSMAVNMALIVLLGALAALVTRRKKALMASLLVVVAVVGYVALARFVFVQSLYALPIVLPVLGALIATHVCLVTHNVIFEQSEKRHIKHVFSRMVSPNVMHELLRKEKLSLAGERREVTIFFADIRGFTAVTDTLQAKAEQVVSRNGWTGQTAEVYLDEVARDILQTINAYLAAVADVVKKYDGTVDKYMGDCVMAFWGAPSANEQHALNAVRAAIGAQRALDQMNRERTIENEHRSKANVRREAAGQPPLDLLPTLTLGTGINTGHAIVGLMGSDARVNYTVFGREVNLASRLEGVSGRSRIIVSESTYQHVLRDDPKLAATFIELEPVSVKGISKPVKIFEVPWAEVLNEPPANIGAATPA